MCEPSFLANPVLAFIKAFRLRGDKQSIVLSATARFDAASLAEAKRVLWEKCRPALEGAGLSLHARRGSERRTQAAAELEDLIDAFDALDSQEQLPSIY